MQTRPDHNSRQKLRKPSNSPQIEEIEARLDRIASTG